MSQIVGKVVSVSLFILCLTASMAVAAEKSMAKGKTEILPASFGSTVPSAVNAIVNISEQVKKPIWKLKFESASPPI